MIDVESIWQTIIAVTLAVAGGLARLLNVKGKSKLKWGKILSELFISGFAGLMVLMLARHFGLSGDLVGVIAGMSGWIGPRVLDVIAKATSKAAGIALDKKSEDN